MRAIMESSFYIIYLLFATISGLFLIFKRNNNKYYKLLGYAIFILGFGDAFHLVPRAIGLFNGTLDYPGPNLAMWLGIGKLVTSITMTIFYLLLYLFIYKRSNTSRNKELDVAFVILFIIRIALCLLPQNKWLTNETNMVFGILRNLPFTIIGIIAIMLSNIQFKDVKPYKGLWILIILSFLFYLPVVLFAHMYKMIGMMMLPKTICYMIIIYLALKDFKLSVKNDNK